MHPLTIGSKLSPIAKEQQTELEVPEGWIPFVVDGIRGPGARSFLPTYARLIPNTDKALRNARISLRRARAAWQN